jgi:YesN/AraC family two-component response regulator
LIRVILADDDERIRSTLRALIERQYPAARIIAEAEDGLAAVSAAEQEKPDLVILDVSMPRMDGFIAAQNINARYPDVPIIMISGHTDITRVREAFRCGAHGYVFKPRVGSELILAINSVLSGVPYEPRQLRMTASAALGDI